MHAVDGPVRSHVELWQKGTVSIAKSDYGCLQLGLLP